MNNQVSEEYCYLERRFVRAVKQGSGFSYDKRLDNPELVSESTLKTSAVPKPSQ